MKHTLSKRILCLLLAAAMVMGFALPANATHAHDTGLSFTKVDTDLSLDKMGQAAAQTEQLPLYEDTDMVRVSILLESASTLESGFSTQDIATNGLAMAYRATLQEEQMLLTDSIERALDGELYVRWNLTLAANLISANVAYGDIARIEAVPGVAEVIIETRYEPCVVDREEEDAPTMQTSTWQVGARTVWANGYTGAGSRVAVIDTGIDTDHQSFSASGFEYSLQCNAEKANMSYEAYVQSLDLLDKEEILSVADQLNIPNVNADRAYNSTKIPFGYNYIDENYKVMHDYDSQGEHGSHVEGIAAANAYIPQRDGSFVEAVDTVGVAGIAPDAQIISMKVFGVNGGAYDSDYMAAIEDAIVLGCDSVNLSLGSSSAGFSFNATYEKLLAGLQETDTVVTISAGNSYGWDENISQKGLYVEDIRFHTGGSPGTYTNSLGVASVDSASVSEDGTYEQTPYQTMSDFSSWGIPDSLEMKPEITAPGGNIYSVNGAVAGGKSYESMSGTSMAAPQMAGAAAVMAQYIRDNGLVEKTGRSVRQLSQSLMMSTALPLLEEETNYYSILKQGAGLVKLDDAIAARSYIFMGEDATATWMDGKVKAELGDDPDRTGLYTFSFSIHNFAETDTTYRLATQLFTQDSDGTYLYQNTTPLSADFSYKIDGVTYTNEVVGIDCDLNDDGLTDTADAQIILNYAAGLLTEIAEIADVDGSGTVDAYDAHLLLAGLQTGTFTVAAGSSVTVAVQAQLTGEQMAALNETYPNGAYIEGFVLVNPETDAEGTACDSTHSIPVLGFYGSWTDPSMFGVSYTEQLYGDSRTAYVGAAESNELVINRAGTAYYQIGNPYALEDSYPEGRAAVRSEDVLESYRATLLRNAAAYVTLIRDASGKVLYQSGSANVYGAYYYTNGGTWRNTDSSVSLGLPVKTLGLKENDRFTVSLVAVPEYYVLGQTVTIDRVIELLDSGVLGKGAALTRQMVVDNTAPELVAVSRGANDANQLVVNCKDNQYVAAMSLRSLDGTTTYATAVPQIFDDPGDLQVVTMDLSGVKAGETCLLILGDYAGNESAYEVTLNLEEPGQGGDSGTTPGGKGGSLFAYSQAQGAWISVDVNGATYANAGTSGASIVAAEYVDGYTYMVTADGGLCVAPHSNRSAMVKLADVSAYGIEDMALSYTDKKLYALGADNTIYTVDLYSGELTSEFTVSVLNSRNETCNWLRGLAIDDEGTFYVIADGGSKYEFGVQAFRFTLDMVVDGAITDLEPFGTGYIGGYSDKGQTLAWDHENDRLFYYGWGRYDIDTLGWINISGSSWTLGGLSAASADLKLKMSAAYFVGSKIGLIEQATQAESLQVNVSELKMMPGSTATVRTTLTPWTLQDQSLSWESSAPEIAAVENGTITALTAGTATITVTTNAEPHLQQTVEVTVNDLPAVDLYSFLMDVDGTSLWVRLNSSSPESWQTVSYDDGGAAYGAVLLKNVVYVHDSSSIYAMDPDMFTKYYVCDIGSYYAWPDAAAAEEVDGFFDRIVAPCNGGSGIAVINPYEATVVEYADAAVLGGDSLVTMAFAGLSYVSVEADGETYTDCPAYTYYSVAESGSIYEIVLAAYPAEEESYDFSIRKTAVAPIKLSGAGELEDSFASSIYDAESGCLALMSYQKNDSTARLYAIEPQGGATLELGNVGDAVWPAYSLYQYQEPADLTLRVRTQSISTYVGDVEQITAYAVPARFQGGVTYTSSDESILTVDAEGRVTAVAPGDASVIVETVDTNAAGETVSQEIPVHVEDVVKIDLTVNAKLELSEDGSNWASIQTNDIKNPSIVHYDHAYLYGGGVHDNVIYGGDNKAYIDWNYWAVVSNLYVIEPEYDYDITPGGIVSYQQAPSDMSTMPALELRYTDDDGNTATLIAGDMPIYVDLSEELIMWNVHELGAVADISGWNLAGEFEGTLGTLAFMGMTKVMKDGQKLDAYSYAALTDSGNLYNIVIVPTVVRDDDGTYAVDYSCDFEKVGNVGLTFASATQMSMVYVNDGVNNGLVVAYYEDTAELYYVDIEVDMLEVKLTGGKIGSIGGASTITALYLPEELTVNAVAPELIHGEIETMQTNALVGPDPSLVYDYQLADDTLAIGGALNAVHAQVQTDESEDGTVTIAVTEDVTVTDGLLEITYDAEKLTYVGTSASCLTAIREEEGKLILAYASGRELLAGKTLALLTFAVREDYVQTEISIRTTHRNNESAVQEAATLVEVTYELGGHAYALADSVDATCTEDGYETYTCAKCGHSYTETLAGTGHSYAAVVTEPTCTEMGYTTYTCEGCGHNYKSDYVNPTGHHFGDWETVKEATCTGKGQEKRTCVCGEAEYRDTDMTAHDYETTVTAPTCTEMGYTTYTCADCGHSYKSDYVNPTGHHFGDWETVKEATCTTKGQEKRTCACGETEYRDTDCIAHSYTRQTAEPTCTKAGFIREVCSECGDSYIVEILEATGHSYEATVTAPTCTEQGYTTHTCHCGDSYVDSYADALGHSYGDWVVLRQETCTEDGERAHVCEQCGHSEKEAIAACCPSEAFTDLSNTAWYHEGVCYALRNGIMNGMGDRIFAPNEAMTRAQLVQTLYRIAGSPDVTDMEQHFTDVADDSWYAEAVIWVVNNKVVQGVSETSFAPDAQITREQLATILYRYAGEQKVEEDHLKDFKDVSTISAYAVDAMNWAVASGLIQGVGENRLAPAETATRAQVATILMRFVRE